MGKSRQIQCEKRNDNIPTRTRDILPRNITNLQPTRIAIAIRVNTRTDINRLIHILELDISKRNIPDVALAGIRLYPRRVTRMDGCDVFEEDVVDCFRHVGGVPHGADYHGSGLVACDVFDVDVCAVALYRYAVLVGC
jgi:hypothetical protein